MLTFTRYIDSAASIGVATGAAEVVTNVALTTGRVSIRTTAAAGGEAVAVAEISVGMTDADSRANGGTTGREVAAPSDREEVAVVAGDHSGTCRHTHKS